MPQEEVEEEEDLISEAPTLYQSSPSLIGTPTAVSDPTAPIEPRAPVLPPSPPQQDQKKLLVGVSIGILALVVLLLFFKALSGPAKKAAIDGASGSQQSGSTGSETEKAPKNHPPKKAENHPTRVVHADPLKWLPDSLSILIQLNLQTYSTESNLDRESIKIFKTNLQRVLERISHSREDCSSFLESLQRVQLAIFSEEGATLVFLHSPEGRVFFSQTRKKAQQRHQCLIEKEKALEFFYKNKPHYLYFLGKVLVLSNSKPLCSEVTTRASTTPLTRSFGSTSGYSRILEKTKEPLWAYFSKTFCNSSHKSSKFSLPDKGLTILNNFGEKRLVDSVEVSWDQVKQQTLFSVEMPLDNPYHSFFLFDKSSQNLLSLLPQKALLGRLNFIDPQRNLGDLSADREILKDWRTLPFYRDISKIRLRGSAIFVSPEVDARTSHTVPVTWYVLLGTQSSCRDLLNRIKGRDFLILPSEYVGQEGLELGYSRGYLIYQRGDALFFGRYPKNIRNMIYGITSNIEKLKRFNRPFIKRMIEDSLRKGVKKLLETLPLTQEAKIWPGGITERGGCSQIHFLRNAEKNEELLFKITHRKRGVSIETNAPVLQALLQRL